jgi:hypothetical protein
VCTGNVNRMFKTVVIICQQNVQNRGNNMSSFKNVDITMQNVQVVIRTMSPIFSFAFGQFKTVSHTSTSILISTFLTLSIKFRPRRDFWYFYAIPSWTWSYGRRTFVPIFLKCERTFAPLITNPFAPRILPCLYFHRRFIETFCPSTFCMYMYYRVSTFQGLTLTFDQLPWNSKYWRQTEEIKV